MSVHSYQFGEMDNKLPFDPIDVWISKTGNTNDYKSIVDQLNQYGYGAFPYDVHLQSPQPTGQFIDNPGIDGQFFLDQKMGTRTLTIDFYMVGSDEFDADMLMHDIYSLFFQRTPYYLRTDIAPGMRYYVIPTPFEFSALSRRENTFSLAFTILKNYAESYGTTLDMFTYDAELWQIGQHLPTGEDLQYVFNANNFRVYNASDIAIDPLQHHEFQIALTGAGTPTITNATTGDVFKLIQAMTADDTLLIDGIYPYLNNNRCGRLTNHGILTLAKGWNNITISGMTNPTSSWLFRYLYH